MRGKGPEQEIAARPELELAAHDDGRAPADADTFDFTITIAGADVAFDTAEILSIEPRFDLAELRRVTDIAIRLMVGGRDEKVGSRDEAPPSSLLSPLS
jgi:hypothetical protein